MKIITFLKIIAFFVIPAGVYASDICKDKKERESSVIEIACRMSVELDINMTHAMSASFLKHVEMDKELCNFSATPNYHQYIKKSLDNQDIAVGKLWFESRIGSNKKILASFPRESKSGYCIARYEMYGPNSKLAFFVKK
jgi:hypothetical protein